MPEVLQQTGPPRRSRPRRSPSATQNAAPAGTCGARSQPWSESSRSSSRPRSRAGGSDSESGPQAARRVLGIAELEQVRDALAIRLREAQAELSARVDVEEQNRELVERMIAEPAAIPLGADLERRRRRARLQALALAPTLGHPRDAARLVAGEALLGLSVSHRTRRRRVPPASLLASVGAFRVASNQKEARSAKARRRARPRRAGSGGDGGARARPPLSTPSRGGGRAASAVGPLPAGRAGGARRDHLSRRRILLRQWRRPGDPDRRRPGTCLDRGA